MKKMIVLSFVAALSVAGCSKKKADTTPTNNAPTTTETKPADAAPTDKPADPCAGATKPADPCAAPKK